MPVSLALPGNVTVLADANAVARGVARWVWTHSGEATALRSGFSIALAGGSTPKLAYQMLATAGDRIAWSGWHVFFGDERACPPHDPQSNYAMARSTLLDHVPIPANQVHRMPADEMDLSAAAKRYSDLLTYAVGDESGIPRLDCVLLGVGENGHTASLFPGDPATQVTNRWCTAARADYQPFDRLTLTFPAINSARNVVFIVTGANKHQALLNVLARTVPAAGVRPEGKLHWFLDAAADGE